MALGLTPLILICTETLFNADGTEAFTKDEKYQTDGYINYYNKIPDESFVLIDNQLDKHQIADKWRNSFKTIGIPFLNEYKFTINSDQGKHNVSTTATDLATALRLLMNAEKCPEGAVLNIKIKKLGHATDNK